MNSKNIIKDVLSWENFYNNSKKRKPYPPKNPAPSFLLNVMLTSVPNAAHKKASFWQMIKNCENSIINIEIKTDPPMFFPFPRMEVKK